MCLYLLLLHVIIVDVLSLQMMKRGFNGDFVSYFFVFMKEN